MTIDSYTIYGQSVIPSPLVNATRDPVNAVDLASPNGGPYQNGQRWFNTSTSTFFTYSGGGVWKNETVNSASTTVSGISRFATHAEVTTGTSTSLSMNVDDATFYLQNPTTIGSVTPNTGKFTTVNTSGNITSATSTAGTNISIISQNTDNTNTASDASMQLVSQPSGGDCYEAFIINGNNTYTFGQNHTNGNLQIATGSKPSTGTVRWNMNNAGQITLAYQPCVSAYKSATTNNVTGDGTVYTVLFDTVIKDQASNYVAGTGIFTAPVTGMYLVSCQTTYSGLGTSNNFATQIVATSRTINLATTNANNGANNYVQLGGVALLDMTATDTFHIAIQASSGAKNIGIIGAAVVQTYLSVNLIC